MRRLLHIACFLFLECTSALRVHHARREVLTAACVACAQPAPAHAQRSSLRGKASKEAEAEARAFKLSPIPQETEAFKAAERRRADFDAGVAPRDANRTPVRDAVTGKSICAENICAKGDSACFALQGSCAKG